MTMALLIIYLIGILESKIKTEMNNTYNAKAKNDSGRVDITHRINKTKAMILILGSRRWIMLSILLYLSM